MSEKVQGKMLARVFLIGIVWLGILCGFHFVLMPLLRRFSLGVSGPWGSIPMLLMLSLWGLGTSFFALLMGRSKRLLRLERDVTSFVSGLGLMVLVLVLTLLRARWESVSQPDWTVWLVPICVAILAGGTAHGLWVRRLCRIVGKSEELRIPIFERFWKGAILFWGLSLALALVVPGLALRKQGTLAALSPPSRSALPTLWDPVVTGDGSSGQIHVLLNLSREIPHGRLIVNACRLTRSGRPAIPLTSMRNLEWTVNVPKKLQLAWNVEGVPSGNYELEADVESFEIIPQYPSDHITLTTSIRIPVQVP